MLSESLKEQDQLTTPPAGIDKPTVLKFPAWASSLQTSQMPSASSLNFVWCNITSCFLDCIAEFVHWLCHIAFVYIKCC